MCLGIPGRVVALDASNDQLALVDIAGTPRTINLALVHDEGVQPGNWLLVHMGFAMEILDEQGAAQVMEGLRLLSEGEIGKSGGPSATGPAED